DMAGWSPFLGGLMWLPPLTRPLAPLSVIVLLGAGCSAENDAGSTPSPPASEPAGTGSPPGPVPPGTSSPGAPSPEPSPRPVELLPDLRSLPGYDLEIEDEGEDRQLRFSSTLANVGAGPVEIRPND